MQTAKTPAEAPWSRNAIASIVALIFCVPMAPVLALLAFRDCAQRPGMKGRGLATVALLVSLAFLTFVVYGLFQGFCRAPGSNG
jgi:hypothetical protein